MMDQASRNLLRLGIVDYLLSAIGCSSAVLALGQSLARPKVGVFGFVVILVGFLFSFAMSRRKDPGKLEGWDPIVYALLAAFAIAFGSSFNALMPSGGFPEDLRHVTAIWWLLLFCSFAAWSDSTLLFQAVPCITLFAFVGVIEMFAASTFAFFIFLIATAFLYARAHHRAMLLQASQAGYRDLATIRKGPWRWVAGPEWAIASAFGVILLSLIGAPVIQRSVQSVAGNVNISASSSTRTPPRSMIGSTISPVALRIGTGPRELSDRVVIQAKLDEPRYLRAATYLTFVPSSGWSRATTNDVSPATIEGLVRDRTERQRSGKMEEVPFRLILNDGLFDDLPLPGEAVSLNPALDWRIRADGTAVPGSNLPVMARVWGTVTVPSKSVQPVNCPSPLPAFLERYADAASVTRRVRRLAFQATRGYETDIEKANALMAAIGARCQYNLNAEPVPLGQDGVDHFLFVSKEGYCDLFASSMVLMARCVGIPARVVTGYYPFLEEKNEQGYYAIRESDGHAWAELYFEGAGWIPFDATETASMAPGSGRGQSTEVIPLVRRAWFQWTLGLMLLALGSLGGMALVSQAKAYRVWSRQDRVIQAQLFQRFCTSIQSVTHRPRRLYESPSEYVAATRKQLIEHGAEAEELAEEFERLFYAPPGSSGGMEVLEHKVDAFVKRLAQFRKAKGS